MQNITTCATPAEAGIRAARRVLELAESCLEKQDTFRVAISGGSLPKLLLPEVVRSGTLERWVFIMADERYVPLNDQDSNYKLVMTYLQDTKAKVIPMNPDVDLEEAAEQYSAVLDSIGGTLDLVLLGMGPDGHTASLFPGHPLMQATTAVAAISDSPKPPPKRITLTLPVLNAASNVLFLVTGEGKRSILDQIKAGSTFPASLVQPTRASWFVDEAAIGLY